MSQFALYYEQADVQAILDQFNRADLSVADKATAMNWATSIGAGVISKSAAPIEWQTAGQPTRFLMVVSATQTATDLLAFLQLFWTNYGTYYMNAIADDIQSALDQPTAIPRNAQDPYP